MRKIAVIFSLFLFTSSIVSAEEKMWLGDWLKLNEPRVKQYLTTLTPEQIGIKLPGVTLSDGTTELRGYTYIANLSDKEKGAHIYKFHHIYRGVRYEVHYMWVDRSGSELDPPACPGKWLVPGGVAVLSGDSYTWAKVYPGGRLVVTHCILSPNQSLQRTGQTVPFVFQW